MLSVNVISLFLSQYIVTCKILLLPARQKLKREELRWNKTRHVAKALWIINPAGHHHGNLVGFRGNVPSVMRALLVRTFPSMNLQMDRMVHTTPLITDTLYRKSSWGKRKRETLSYWARRDVQGSSAVFYTTPICMADSRGNQGRRRKRAAIKNGISVYCWQETEIHMAYYLVMGNRKHFKL